MTISVLGAEEAIGDVLPPFCVGSLLLLLDGLKSGFLPAFLTSLFSSPQKVDSRSVYWPTQDSCSSRTLLEGREEFEFKTFSF